MPHSHLRSLLIPLCIVAMGFVSMIEANDASAQAVKRSAGPVVRSMGSRQGGLGSSRRGHESNMDASRSSSKPDFRSLDDDEKEEEAEDEPSDRSSDSDDADEKDADDESRSEEEEVDYGARTLGRACMYGTRGEVIYRPAGSRCRGDAAAPPAAAAPSKGKTPTARVRAETRARDPREEPPRPAARAEASSEGRSRGTCIYGADGRVIHAPPGAGCRR